MSASTSPSPSPSPSPPSIPPPIHALHAPSSASPYGHRLLMLVDMDCFYAQVERERFPHLRHTPLSVVQNGTLLVTTNYSVRFRTQLKMGNPHELKKVVPSAKFIGSDMKRYRDMCRKWMECFSSFGCPLYKKGIDECYIDLTSIVYQRVRKREFYTVIPHRNPDGEKEKAKKRMSEAEIRWRREEEIMKMSIETGETIEKLQAFFEGNNKNNTSDISTNNNIDNDMTSSTSATVTPVPSASSSSVPMKPKLNITNERLNEYRQRLLSSSTSTSSSPSSSSSASFPLHLFPSSGELEGAVLASQSMDPISSMRRTHQMALGKPVEGLDYDGWKGNNNTAPTTHGTTKMTPNYNNDPIKSLLPSPNALPTPSLNSILSNRSEEEIEEEIEKLFPIEFCRAYKGQKGPIELIPIEDITKATEEEIRNGYVGEFLFDGRERGAAQMNLKAKEENKSNKNNDNVTSSSWSFPSLSPPESHVVPLKLSFSDEDFSSPSLSLLYFTASQLAYSIRYKLFSLYGLTTSAAITPSPMLSKVFASLHKPNVQTIVRGEMDIIKPGVRGIKIKDIGGFGPKSVKYVEEKCRGMKVGEIYKEIPSLFPSPPPPHLLSLSPTPLTVLGQLQLLPYNFLLSHFGDEVGHWLHNMGEGVDVHQHHQFQILSMAAAKKMREGMIGGGLGGQGGIHGNGIGGGDFMGEGSGSVLNAAPKTIGQSKRQTVTTLAEKLELLRWLADKLWERVEEDRLEYKRLPNSFLLSYFGATYDITQSKRVSIPLLPHHPTPATYLYDLSVQLMNDNNFLPHAFKAKGIMISVTNFRPLQEGKGIKGYFGAGNGKEKEKDKVKFKEEKEKNEGDEDSDMEDVMEIGIKEEREDGDADGDMVMTVPIKKEEKIKSEKEKIALLSPSPSPPIRIFGPMKMFLNSQNQNSNKNKPIPSLSSSSLPSRSSVSSSSSPSSSSPPSSSTIDAMFSLPSSSSNHSDSSSSSSQKIHHHHDGDIINVDDDDDDDGDVFDLSMDIEEEDAEDDVIESQNDKEIKTEIRNNINDNENTKHPVDVSSSSSSPSSSSPSTSPSSIDSFFRIEQSKSVSLSPSPSSSVFLCPICHISIPLSSSSSHSDFHVAESIQKEIRRQDREEREKQFEAKRKERETEKKKEKEKEKEKWKDKEKDKEHHGGKGKSKSSLSSSSPSHSLHNLFAKNHFTKKSEKEKEWKEKEKENEKK